MNWLTQYFSYPDNSHFMSGHYNDFLVLVSVLIAILASFMSLQVMSYSRLYKTSLQKKAALLAASIALGVGIWSMHFIGMLAFDMQMQMDYDVPLTLLSILPGTVASAIALNTLFKSNVSMRGLVVSGTLVGAGIGVMHYTGMAAMKMDALLRYDFATFCLSIVVAVGLSILSLWVRFNLTISQRYLRSEMSLNLISGLILGGAISTMHYVGMGAARYIGTHDITHISLGDTSEFLAFKVAVITIFALFFVLGVNLLIKYRIVSANAQNNERRIHAIMNTAIHGIVTIDRDGIVLTVNEAVERILGWDRQSLIGQNVSILTPPEHAKQHDSYIQRFISTKQTHIIGIGREVEAVHKNGQRVAIHLAIGHVELPDEDIFVGFITDISDRLAAEQHLRENEEKYRTLIGNIPGAAYRCHASNDWQMIFISDAIEAMTGYSAGAFLSVDNDVSFGKIIHPEDTELTQSILDDAGKFQVEYRIYHRDGSVRWMLDAGECIKDQHGNIEWIDGFIMDITERKVMEEALLLEKEKAETASAIKTNFLANMSHEIRTPLNAILGFSDILLKEDMKPEHQKHLYTINNSAQSLLHLLNDILDSAKIEKGKLTLEYTHYSLHQMIDMVISTMWLAARKKALSLTFHIGDDVPNFIYAAEDRVRQVLINLMGNAIKFTHEGSVVLNVDKINANQLKFSIRDTGIGIAADRLKSIFEPFTQADASMTRRFGGTGLGTTISKELVGLMGGELSATSVEGEGSCFEFTIPLVLGDRQKAMVKQEIVVDLSPIKLLVVDDIRQNRDLLETYFVGNGHQVVTASDGQEAIDLVKTQQFDVILMDVQMPNIDGHAASEQIIAWEQQADISHTPIIALTASVLSEDKAAARNAGMDGFATKPVNFQQVCTEIARVTGVAHKTIKQNKQNHQFDSNLINDEAALALWQSEDVFFKELNVFLNQNKSLVTELKSLMSDKDSLPFLAKVHAMKGISGNLALTKLEEHFVMLESAFKDKQYDSCDVIIEHIEQQIELLELEYQRLNTEQIEMKKVSSNIQLASEEILIILDTLIKTAQSNEYDEATLSRLIAGANPDVASLVNDIEAAFEEFDFDVAETLLQEMKKRLLQE